MSDLLSRDDVLKTAREWFSDVFGATDLTGLEERLMELDVVDKTEPPKITLESAVELPAPLEDTNDEYLIYRECAMEAKKRFRREVEV